MRAPGLAIRNQAGQWFEAERTAVRGNRFGEGHSHWYRALLAALGRSTLEGHRPIDFATLWVIQVCDCPHIGVDKLGQIKIERSRRNV